MFACRGGESRLDPFERISLEIFFSRWILSTIRTKSTLIQLLRGMLKSIRPWPAERTLGRSRAGHSRKNNTGPDQMGGSDVRNRGAPK